MNTPLDSQYLKPQQQPQANALGVDPAVVFVPHPIQDRTDAEMYALADAAVTEILRCISTGKY